MRQRRLILIITLLKTLKSTKSEKMARIHHMVPLATILNFQFIMNGMPLGHTQDNTPSWIIITGHYSLRWLTQFRLLKLTVNLHSNKSSMSENIQCKQCPNV